ncbi:MAG: hypothetical protein IPN58_09105 [Anaerolineales bacterium]|nr:hypothetical protein [Anaerolineales bacterium]
MANIGIIWKIQKKEVQDALILSTGILFLSLPFIIQTSWSHYFVYLPFFQTVILVQSLKNFKGNKEFTPALALTILSCAASSVFAFNLFPDWSEYNDAGMLFTSNLLLLFAFYLVLWSRYKNSADA